MRAPDKATFFAAYRRTLGGLKPAQVAPLEFLLDALAADPLVTDIRQAAYMLATAKHETADTFLPVREAFWKDEAWRQRNLRYWPFYGRGFVQLTWEKNYRAAGAVVGIDLVNNPDAALQPDVAYRIMSWGMFGGHYTGKKLADYLTPARTDYVNSRRIINGSDKAALVAGYAEGFERCLGAATFHGATA